MAKMIYFRCDCVKRGHCFVPGTRGTLAVVTQNKVIVCAPCRYCGK